MSPSSFLRTAYLRERHFYRRYHTHPVNALIHVATVPLEWFSTFLLVAACLSPWIAQAFGLALAAYHLCGLGISRAAVWATSTALVGLGYAASALAARVPRGHAATAAVVGHAVAWALQVCGARGAIMR